MKNKLNKIAIIYSGGKYFGGIERYLYNLFENINSQEFEVELISLGSWELTRRLKSTGRQVKLFDSSRINPAAIKEIGMYLQDNQTDLIVSQGVVANAYARAVSLFYKIPNIVTVHSTIGGDYKNVIIKSAYRFIEWATRFRTSHYIVVSNYLKKELINSGIAAKKITVVNNGIDFPVAKKRPHKRLVIGSAGRLHPVKGYDLLIQAFAGLKNTRLRLRIAGSGDELELLKKLAADLNVADRVEFVGFKNDIYEFLDSVDIYVQTSRSEGFGLSVIEAMSCGLPVVVTPAGSLKEIVIDGKTGYVSKDMSVSGIQNAIERLLGSYESSKLFGESGREYVRQNYSISRWVQATQAAYRKAIK